MPRRIDAEIDHYLRRRNRHLVWYKRSYPRDDKEINVEKQTPQSVDVDRNGNQTEKSSGIFESSAATAQIDTRYLASNLLSHLTQDLGRMRALC